MEEKEKIEFNFADFDEEWEENLKDVDEEIKAKVKDTDREFARGFYWALENLDTMIANAVDDICDDNSNKLEEIKKEIVEDAGERIKEYMAAEFDEMLIWLVEKYA